ncbi:MAG: hypothetical protein ABSF22_22155 [Bryobacteraceae bacterium]
MYSSFKGILLENGYVGGGGNGFEGYPIFMAKDEQVEQGPKNSEDGIDLTLIDWMLSLTPAERLNFLEEQINCILEIRELNGRA